MSEEERAVIEAEIEEYEKQIDEYWKEWCEEEDYDIKQDISREMDYLEGCINRLYARL